ncbi:hypothetical protein AMJ71_03565 [candidate division TA06 bacterium SM1_40]|jgi:2-amino-4-hydroxy-6-hydroxymethyldihydropteridine diphosphokinase|uniref:2-amino-4-hydroxy-6-hydroxymethyldihydropteridine diphosphokinase n=1 Tax=candidate division TA06 bacterium SM1_40 TaxID=1703773 RepID=A0A0S8JN81_UNCT6|nr:MAG: hypothetical protein AMJ71_03565 [candidate division TA06 bacterium SM1_40]
MSDESDQEASIAFIGLGSNMGDRLANLEDGVVRLARNPSVSLIGRSRLYETEPVGGPPECKYLNAVVSIETVLRPTELLALLRDIERALGRRPHRRFEPRTLDLDILLYGTMLVEEDALVIPHPRMCERAFVLVPLAEIAADFIHPRCGLPISTLLDRVEGRQGVRLYGSDRWKNLAT